VPVRRSGSRSRNSRTVPIISARLLPAIMWACGWWVIADPQACCIGVIPVQAPKCLGRLQWVSIALNRRSSIIALFRQAMSPKCLRCSLPNSPVGSRRIFCGNRCAIAQSAITAATARNKLLLAKFPAGKEGAPASTLASAGRRRSLRTTPLTLPPRQTPACAAAHPASAAGRGTPCTRPPVRASRRRRGCRRAGALRSRDRTRRQLP
jgi:hypothetical protein